MKRIFNPKSIALIGASEEAGTVGFGLAKNLLEGKDSRKVYFINPKREEVLGVECFKSILDIKAKIDLAVIAVPASIVKDIVSACCEKKVGGIIIISSGFKESGKEKEELEIRDIARKYRIPLIGPNCLGIINPSINLNASFAPVTPKKGNIAFLSQSGALLDSVIDKNSLGFSKIVSYGNEADLDLADFVDYLKTDEETKVISIYFEGIKDGRKFMRIASEASKIKPIVAIKSGRSDKGKEAAGTHTGTLAGDYSVYAAAMKQSGVILVDTLEELFDVSLALSSLPRCDNGIGIITNGGGLGVLALDYSCEAGIEIPDLSTATLSLLEKSKSMEKVVNKSNPLDLLGDALSDRYAIGIESMLKQKDINGLLVISTPQLMTEHEKNAKIVVELKNKYPLKPIVCCFLGGQSVNSSIKYLEENGIPNYADVKRAVKSIKSLIRL